MPCRSLGLRSSEVVRLSLDDIDWQAGTIRITLGKGRRADVLPLPGATGEAIADYLLHERPKTTCRQIFVRHVAPLGEPVGRRVVQKAVHAAYQRLGWDRTRVHILRHTLATRDFARSHANSPISDPTHRDSNRFSFRSFKTPARPAIGRQNGRRIALQWGSVAPTKVKPIDSTLPDQAAFAAIGPRTPLASGMAAREGEDPHAGLQRSRQPGPTGRRPIALSTNPQTQIGGMCNDYERHILWAEPELMQARAPESS